MYVYIIKKQNLFQTLQWAPPTPFLPKNQHQLENASYDTPHENQETDIILMGTVDETAATFGKMGGTGVAVHVDHAQDHVLKRDSCWLRRNTPLQFNIWNAKMKVWKMIFLFKHVIFMLHVNFPGCIPKKSLALLIVVKFLTVSLFLEQRSRFVYGSCLFIVVFQYFPIKMTNHCHS